MPLRDFVALSPADFEELAGSSWRSRDNLGGLLAKTLRGTLKRPYKSWGVKRRLELHIANENHYSFEDPFPFPKLFVYSKGQLAYGFYIEAPMDPERPDSGKYIYWRGFRKQLQYEPSLCETLLQVMEKHQLTLTDYYRPSGGVFGGTFGVKDDAIQFKSSDGNSYDAVSRDEFVHRITEPESKEWMDLHIFKMLDKATAIRLKGEVATPILSVLQDLAPIYERAISLEDEH